MPLKKQNSDEQYASSLGRLCFKREKAERGILIRVELRSIKAEEGEERRIWSPNARVFISIERLMLS